MVEHVFSRFTEIDNPLGQARVFYSVGHVLGIDRTGGVIIAANSADAAGDEMRVPRILVLHENRITAENG